MKVDADTLPPRGPTGALVATVALLLLGLIPTEGRGVLTSALRSLHKLTPNRLARDEQSTGYYDGLIDGKSRGRDELTLTLLGKPPEWAQFTDIQAARYRRGEVLQFELKPDIDSMVLGTRFTTNAHGMRDRPYSIEKPANVFRIALLGSSIDMGWGVSTADTYENRLEEWLNTQAARRGMTRRFEILNFAMAAYSPLHRLEVFTTKVLPFQPDAVIYSATRLDTRLLQIQLTGLLQDGTDLKYDHVKTFIRSCGIDQAHLPRDSSGSLREKDLVKTLLEPHLLELDEATVRVLSERARSAGVPLIYLMIPRASEDDGPALRAADVARMHALAQGLGLPVLDVTDAFDHDDPGLVEIAPWDDHPNKRGHERLFHAMGRGILESPALSHLLFETSSEMALQVTP